MGRWRFDAQRDARRSRGVRSRVEPRTAPRSDHQTPPIFTLSRPPPAEVRTLGQCRTEVRRSSRRQGPRSDVVRQERGHLAPEAQRRVRVSARRLAGTSICLRFGDRRAGAPEFTPALAGVSNPRERIGGDSARSESLVDHAAFVRKSNCEPTPVRPPNPDALRSLPTPSGRGSKPRPVPDGSPAFLAPANATRCSGGRSSRFARDTFALLTPA